MNEHSHRHEFSLGFSAIDGKLPGEGVVIDLWFFFLHYKRFIYLGILTKIPHLNADILNFDPILISNLALLLFSHLFHFIGLIISYYPLYINIIHPTLNIIAFFILSIQPLT